ncbi:hypothetical protein AN644_03195 [Candidatus Epulonipiscium fishelsonii]|nr:hypothetical protein AN644_03195 [Epulopiscium sp. SCG-C06WGA-EpuloA1]
MRIKYINKVIGYIRKNGILATCDKIRTSYITYINYDKWIRNRLPSAQELYMQSKYKFKFSPIISLIVYIQNAQKNFLIEMIKSVRNQSYAKWELCIADACLENVETRKILKYYAKKDKRIKLKFLSGNHSIAEISNKALDLATGEYIALLNQDDLLAPNALFEVVKVLNQNEHIDFIYSDEDRIDESSKKYYLANFKPDFAPDLLRSQNYIGHFSIFKADLLEKVGTFHYKYGESQDYDLFLRISEITDRFYHIPKVLYHSRTYKLQNCKSKAGAKAIQDHIDRIGLKGKVISGKIDGVYKIKYAINNLDKVSIIIPNKDHKADLEKCINSILEKTTYKNYEIIIVENNSTSSSIKKYYKYLRKNNNIKIVRWTGEFNYSAINNFGVKFATGKYYILLNNDIEVITPNWIEEMIMYCQREDVGIVGAKLYYPDDTIQHAGVILGLSGAAGHHHILFKRKSLGYFCRLILAQNFSAVTAACLMIKASTYDEVDGLDEAFKVGYNDIDLCMKVRSLGKLVVWTPFAELYHYESKSRGYDSSQEKIERAMEEKQLFRIKWHYELEKGDPYYNVNLTLDSWNFGLKK